jgi:hypothetical protein
MLEVEALQQLVEAVHLVVQVLAGEALQVALEPKEVALQEVLEQVAMASLAPVVEA